MITFSTSEAEFERLDVQSHLHIKTLPQKQNQSLWPFPGHGLLPSRDVHCCISSTVIGRSQTHKTVPLPHSERRNLVLQRFSLA